VKVTVSVAASPKITSPLNVAEEENVVEPVTVSVPETDKLPPILTLPVVDKDAALTLPGTETESPLVPSVIVPVPDDVKTERVPPVLPLIPAPTSSASVSARLVSLPFW
jgi:hypothetical protein